MKGFTLIEILTALALFLIGILVLFGAVRNMMDVSRRMNEESETMARMEEFLFELETGMRDDLFYGGGHESRDGFRCDLETEADLPSYRQIHLTGRTGAGKNPVHLDVLLRDPNA